MIKPMDIITALDIDMAKAALRAMTDTAFCEKVGVSSATFRRVYRTVDDSPDAQKPDREASIKVVNEFAEKVGISLSKAGCTFTDSGCFCVPGMKKSAFKAGVDPTPTPTRESE